MKLPLLLALLFGTVSSLHLRTETSKFESSLGDKSLPQDGKTPEQEAEKSPTGELALQEEEEERDSRSEDFPGEEEPMDSVSDLMEVDSGLQCPKEENTVKLVGSFGHKSKHFILVRTAKSFSDAQASCQKCYRANLASIHSYNSNSQIHKWVRKINQGRLWIGGRISGSDSQRCFSWVDGSSWNFAYWAAGQPEAKTGQCVAMCTRGGRWSGVNCATQLPFICSA